MIATTRVLVTLRLSYGTISQERCIVTYLMVNFIFNWIIHLIVRILGSILNPQGFSDSWWNIHKAFWHLKVSQPLRYFWINLVFVSSPQWIFISSRSVSLMPPRWRNSSQVLPRKIYENFTFSLMSQAVPAGAQRQGVSSSFPLLPRKLFHIVGPCINIPNLNLRSLVFGFL